MFGIVRRNKKVVRDRTVYMEVYGDNKVMYRVVVGKINSYGDEVCTYGIEAEDRRSGGSNSGFFAEYRGRCRLCGDAYKRQGKSASDIFKGSELSLCFHMNKKFSILV